ncbi:adaptin ear-binding coat-associated protein 2 [Thozetella sp. PMI_491]|nr:adaptin ear-binding coat-associated protein 2 [Thozetella sp. PMI_491]
METIDPATGQPLPGDAIQRILFIGNTVHVYNIPPQASARGHMAATWTEDPKRHIFTCRVRVIETAIPQPGGADDKVKTDIVLEDPSNGQLFAAAPYTTPAIVEPAVDSSRFFALRVQDEAGRKATLGIGYEERSEAFDFGVALQDARRSLGLDGPGSGPAGKLAVQEKPEEKRDYSLKEGETITVNLSGTKFGRRARPSEPTSEPSSGAGLSAFSLPPPPSTSSSGGAAFLPPPPSAQEVRKKRLSAQDLGFDDGQFNEFA